MHVQPSSHRRALLGASLLLTFSTVTFRLSAAQADKTPGQPGAVAAPTETLKKESGVTENPAPSTSAAGPSKEGAVQLDKIEVTSGKVKPFTTRNVDIPRSVDDAQAYYMFDATTIERSGANSTEEFIRQKLTMNTASSNNAQSFFIGGTRSSVNLRGLGDGQTLVLINGRRAFGQNFAVNGGGTQPDLSSIPLGSIDRIEVLPTSASAIYGGNAVGGVVNIVLKRKYQGGELRTTYQNPDDTDAPIRRLDFNYGFSLEGGRTQIMLTASYSDQASIKYQDRPFMRAYDYRNLYNTGVSTGSFPVAALPNIRSNTTGLNLTLKSGGSIGSTFTFVPYGTTPTTSTATLSAALLANAGKFNADRATYGRQIRGGDLADVGTVSRLKSFGLTLRREMTANLEFNVEFSTASAIAIRDMTITTSQSVPAAAPSNPFTTPVSVTLQIPGFQPVWSDNVTRRITTGFTYKLPHDWTAQGDYSWTRGTNSFYNTGTYATTDITNDLTSGKLNPFIDTTAYFFDLAPYQGLNNYYGAAGTNNVALRASGPVWHLPAGAPTLTVGAETRQEGYGNAHTYNVYPNYSARNTYSIAPGKRQTTHGFYAETNIPIISDAQKLPLVRQLDLQIAGRREEFKVRTGTSSFAVIPAPVTPVVLLNNSAEYASTNPTVGLRYKPLDSVLMRVSYSRGFVAPSYSQLMSNPTPSTTPTTISDPRRGGASYGVTTFSGGNPGLQPENSQSWNAGIVFEPRAGALKGLRLSADYYAIRKQDNIGTLGAQVTIENENLFPDRVIRSTPVAGDPFGVGTITAVNIASINLLKAFLEGFDLSAGYRKDTARLGSFTFNALATVVNHSKRKTTFGQPYIDSTNFSGSTGGLKFQGNASLTWDYRNWTAGWTTRYYNAIRISAPPVTTSLASVTAQGGQFIPAQSYSDLFVTYRFIGKGAGATLWKDRALRNVEVQFGVSNIFKKTPPYDVGSFGSYYYSTYGDLRWRDLRLSVKKTF